MIKDNPIYNLAKKANRSYYKVILSYSSRAEEFLKKHNLVPTNQAFLDRWLMNVGGQLSADTEKFLFHAVEEVIDTTLELYNKLDKDKGRGGLSNTKIAELKLKIMKEFFLTKFKEKTLNTRLIQADRRLKVNLKAGLSSLIQAEITRSKDLKTFTHSITGKDFIQGGSAYKWNSRLILSEMFRAYQFSARYILEELNVSQVEWRNTKRHTTENIIDEYAQKTYKPSELPEYPYPCNDSYFIPIY